MFKSYITLLFTSQYCSAYGTYGLCFIMNEKIIDDYLRKIKAVMMDDSRHRYKLIVRLIHHMAYDLGDCSLIEAARILGISYKTVKPHIVDFDEFNVKFDQHMNELTKRNLITPKNIVEAERVGEELIRCLTQK